MSNSLKVFGILSGLAVFVAVSILANSADRYSAPAFAGPSEKPAESNATATVRKPKFDMMKIAYAYSLYVDKNGNISLPKDYMTKWSHLGSFAIAKKNGQDVLSMHGVYTQPEVIDIFNRTGNFPDGTVLIKEVRSAKSGKMTTGHVAWSTGMNMWFVMIKDAKGRFKDSDHWGDGWGWALFEAKDKAPRKNVSDGYSTSCIGCHIPAQKTDWIYMRGYPTLQAPKDTSARFRNVTFQDYVMCFTKRLLPPCR